MAVAARRNDHRDHRGSQATPAVHHVLGARSSRRTSADRLMAEHARTESCRRIAESTKPRCPSFSVQGPGEITIWLGSHAAICSRPRRRCDAGVRVRAGSPDAAGCREAVVVDQEQHRRLECQHLFSRGHDPRRGVLGGDAARTGGSTPASRRPVRGSEAFIPARRAGSCPQPRGKSRALFSVSVHSFRHRIVDDAAPTRGRAPSPVTAVRIAIAVSMSS